MLTNFESVYQSLIEYFESEGWTIDIKKGEALMSSGYGSGPAVVDLNNLTVKILEVLK